MQEIILVRIGFISLVFVNILKWKLFKQAKKGDIIVAENPFKPGYTIVKRVTHVEGEMAQVKRSGEVQQVLIPKNHIWIEGDTKDWKLNKILIRCNKQNSRDSRDFGPISKNLVIGFVTYRLWPFSKIMKLE